MMFFIALLGYLILSLYLVIIALSEEPIKRHKVLISFCGLLLSIYALAYYFEAVALPPLML